MAGVLAGPQGAALEDGEAFEQLLEAAEPGKEPSLRPALTLCSILL